MPAPRTTCDFCSAELSVVYAVPDSPRGVEVAVCRACGLAQSLASAVKPPLREVLASSGPNWGNIRHGKELRFQAHLPVLRDMAPQSGLRRVLDVGSNRGAFVMWLHEHYPECRITAVEPDENVVNAYRSQEQTDLLLTRLEDVDLPEGAFDLVYCSHTLEHAPSASGMLAAIHRALRIGGSLFLEVPNIEGIAAADVVEEFFIDKHTFHLHRTILLRYLAHAGFEVLFGQDEQDPANITVVATRSAGRLAGSPPEVRLFAEQSKLILEYSQRLRENRIRLKHAASALYELTGRQRVVFWGGGRIFDALVKFGEFRTDRLCGVIDTYLAKHLREVHGIALQGPSYLRLAQPDVVVILARSSAGQIEKEVRHYGIRHVVQFRDLMMSV